MSHPGQAVKKSRDGLSKKKTALNRHQPICVGLASTAPSWSGADNNNICCQRTGLRA
jgi:hypothetical protein